MARLFYSGEAVCSHTRLNRTYSCFNLIFIYRKVKMKHVNERRKKNNGTSRFPLRDPNQIHILAHTSYKHLFIFYSFSFCLSFIITFFLFTLFFTCHSLKAESLALIEQRRRENICITSSSFFFLF